MKKIKFVSGILSAAVLTGAIGIVPATAEDSDVVYTYQNESGQTVNITQGELDAGHWNVNALGDTLPIVYEDFPAIIDDFVNDYADMKISIRYLKSVGNGLSATITIRDIESGSIILQSDLTESVLYTDFVDINKEYKLTISEDVNGETTEYNKVVRTGITTAEMPSYITDDIDSDSNILIGNVEDLRASTTVNENGEISVDGTMPRYVSVTADNFDAYIDNLQENSIYRIYTKDEAGNPYAGFISTFENGEQLGIYTPNITVISWDNYTGIMPYTLPSASYITAARVKNATKIEMTHSRDYNYSFSSSYFKVYAYPVDQISVDDNINWVLRASDSVGVQVWTATSLTSTPVYCHTTVATSGNINMRATTDGYAASAGEYIFFVVYLTDTMEGNGVISVTSVDRYPTEDVTGFAYEAYAGGGSASMSPTTYYLYDDRDADVFYINSGSTQKTYIATLNNEVETIGERMSAKYLEVAYYCNQKETFSTETAPFDIITVEAGETGAYSFIVNPDMQGFIYIYNAEPAGGQSRYSIGYSR